jgi:hypothetical protein
MLHFNGRYLAGSFAAALVAGGALGAAAREKLWGVSPSFAVAAGLGVLAVGLLWALLAGQRDKLAMIPAPATPSELEKLAGAVYRRAKRLAVLIVGVSLLVIGLAMVVLPGPAIVMIPFSLLVLGTEFAWAKRLLDQIARSFPALAKGEEEALEAISGAASSKNPKNRSPKASPANA